MRLLAMALLSCLAAGAQAQDFRVTLLGTGSPNPLPGRFGPATLVEAGPEKLLFDAGRGVTIRLNQIKVPMGAITATFLTCFIPTTSTACPICGSPAGSTGPTRRGADRSASSDRPARRP